MLAQLPIDGKAYELENLFKSKNWGCQQKMDGHRYLIDVKSRKSYNRKGEEKHHPINLEVLASLGNWILDGELVGNKYYVFDGIHGDDRQDPFNLRYFALKQDIAELNSPLVNIVPLVTEEEEKRKLYDFVKTNKGEGVVFRLLDSLYQSGKSHHVYKYKFYKDVDCFIGDTDEDKANVSLYMYRGDRKVEVAKCSTLTGDGPSLKPDDVVKVKFLYVSKEGRLYQPTLPKIRTDKTKEECTIDQLDSFKTDKQLFYEPAPLS